MPTTPSTLIRLPRRKQVFPAARLADGGIHIGGVDRRWAALVDDPTGHIWRLLGLLDGTRDVEAVHRDLGADAAGVTLDEVATGIDALADAGYVEEAAPPAHPLGERYARNESFFSLWTRNHHHARDLQARLRLQRVTVIGVGGLGGAVAAALAGLGVAELRLVDFDTVDPSNLNRQFLYTDADAASAQKKVAGAAARLRAINPDVEIAAVDREITGPADVAAVTRDADLVVCAADRPRALLHQWINEVCLSTGTPWLYGASLGLTLLAVGFAPGSGCFECMRRAFDDPGRGDVDWLGIEDRDGSDLTVSPCIAPTSLLMGGLCSMLALRMLLNLQPLPDAASATRLAGVARYLDVDGLELLARPFDRDPRCPACGADPSQEG